MERFLSQISQWVDSKRVYFPSCSYKLVRCEGVLHAGDLHQQFVLEFFDSRISVKYEENQEEDASFRQAAKSYGKAWIGVIDSFTNFCSSLEDFKQFGISSFELLMCVLKAGLQLHLVCVQENSPIFYENTSSSPRITRLLSPFPLAAVSVSVPSTSKFEALYGVSERQFLCDTLYSAQMFSSDPAFKAEADYVALSVLHSRDLHLNSFAPLITPASSSRLGRFTSENLVVLFRDCIDSKSDIVGLSLLHSSNVHLLDVLPLLGSFSPRPIHEQELPATDHQVLSEYFSL